MKLLNLFLAAILLSSANAWALNFETRIIKDIEKEISAMGSIGAHEIEIIDQRGAVTLKGFVTSEQLRSRIEQSALAVNGVSSVHNQLEIRFQPRQIVRKSATMQMESPDDMTLLRSVKQSLARQSDIDLKGLGIDVRNGVVYFSGSLDNHRAVDRILSHTLMVNGVRDVASELKIKGQEYR